MAYKHILLEIYCSYNYRKDKSIKPPEYCRYGVDFPGYHCFDNECSFRSFTQCPNEFAYAGEFGEMKDGNSYIGFGGEMEPDDEYDEKERAKLLKLWENISKKKIIEAHDEFMRAKKNMSK